VTVRAYITLLVFSEKKKKPQSKTKPRLREALCRVKRAHIDHGWHFWRGFNRAEEVVQPVNNLQKPLQPFHASVSLSRRRNFMQRPSGKKLWGSSEKYKDSPLVSSGLSTSSGSPCSDYNLCWDTLSEPRSSGCRSPDHPQALAPGVCKSVTLWARQTTLDPTRENPRVNCICYHHHWSLQVPVGEEEPESEARRLKK